MIDSVLGGAAAPGWIDSVFGDSTGVLVAVAVGATLLLTALTGGFTVINEYLTTKVTQHMGLDFRGDMFQHLTRLSLTYHDKTRLGITHVPAQHAVVRDREHRDRSAADRPERA